MTKSKTIENENKKSKTKTKSNELRNENVKSCSSIMRSRPCIRETRMTVIRKTVTENGKNKNRNLNEKYIVKLKLKK